MKNKILFMAMLIAVLTFVFTASAFAEIEITKCEISEDGTSLILEGQASKAGNRITLEIMESTLSEDDISSFEGGSFVSLFENIFELTSDAEGKFSVNPALFGNSGYYTIRAKEMGDDSIKTFGDAFYFASKSDEGTILNIINGADTDEEMSGAISEVYKSLYINYSDFENFTAEEKEKIASFMLASNKEDFESLSDASKNLSMAIMLTSLKNADGNTLPLFEDEMKYIGFSEGNVLYDAFVGILSKADREKIVSDFTENAPYDNMEEATKKLYDAILLKSIEECDNYMEVEKLFEGLKDYLGDNIKNYNKYSSKSKIAKAVVGESFKDTDELFSFIDKKIRQASEDKSTGTGGGSSSSGGGGGSVTVTNPAPTISPKPPVKKEPFDDIGAFGWAKNSINALYEKGIISGKGEGVFAPSDFVTREEFVKLIVGAFYSVDKEAESGFEDVKSDRWSYPYISTSSKLGIIFGKSDTHFGASDKISRQDASVIIHRCINGGSQEDKGVSFTDDVKVSPYAKDAVAFMKNAGIILGREDGAFYPLDNLTRAEAAVIINRALSFER